MAGSWYPQLPSSGETHVGSLWNSCSMGGGRKTPQLLNTPGTFWAPPSSVVALGSLFLLRFPTISTPSLLFRFKGDVGFQD